MDWFYDQQKRRWKATIGEWIAIVQRAHESDMWYGVIERTGAQHERYKSGDFAWPQEARVWSEIQIDRLKGRKKR